MSKRTERICAAIVCACLVFALAVAGGFLLNSEYRHVTWEGDTDEKMLQQVREDIATAKWYRQNLRVQFSSVGGSPLICLEIARVIRNASDEGLVIEIHASAVVASCGTFVLAAGTPGYRYISKTTLFLIHPLQQVSFYGAQCLSRSENPKTEEEKIIAELYHLMASSYQRYTGASYKTALSWLECGKEAVGVNTALIRGLADHVEQ